MIPAMTDGRGPAHRHWRGHVTDAVDGEPLAALVILGAALPLVLGACILAWGRRLRSRRPT
jgi:hypothetical protein